MLTISTLASDHKNNYTVWKYLIRILARKFDFEGLFFSKKTLYFKKYISIVTIDQLINKSHINVIKKILTTKYF